MNVNMEWGILNIFVPRAEMLLIQTVPSEIRQLDLTEFRYAMHDKQDDAEGMSFLHMHTHNPPVTVAGTTLAQVVEVVNNYTVTFENGLYNVNIVGGNSNVSDVVIKNQVGVNTANSAGLQDSSSLQAASFGGVVTIDQVNGTNGTTFPIGTTGTPVKTVTDARSIMNNQNIRRLSVLGDATFTTGDDISNIIIIGQNPINTTTTILDDALTNNSQVEQSTVTGLLDNGTALVDCIIDGIDYFNGFMLRCGLTKNPIILGGNTQASLINCYSVVAGIDTAKINFNGAGQSAIVRGFSGGFRSLNRTGSDQASFDFNSGHCIIDSTCTGSPITARGSYKLTVDSGATYPDTVGRDAMDSTVSYQNQSVYIDTEQIENGDGSARRPFNNVADTTDFAEANGINTVYIYSDVEIDRNVKNFTVIGIGTPVIECNGHDLKNSEFFGVELRGTYTEKIKAKECVLGNNFELNGSFKNCAVINNIVCIDGGNVTMYKCFGNNGGANLSLNGAGSSVVSVIDFDNDLTITDVDNALDEVKVSMKTNRLILDATCTDGIIEVSGSPLLTDNTNGALVDTSAMIPNVTLDFDTECQ